MSRRARRVMGAALLALSLFAAVPIAADEHDPKRSGHPLRIAAYIAHPIGVLLDTIIFRPAHWVVEREPFKTIFGHQG